MYRHRTRTMHNTSRYKRRLFSESQVGPEPVTAVQRDRHRGAVQRFYYAFYLSLHAAVAASIFVSASLLFK